MRSFGASVAVIVALAGCGGATNGASAVADPGRDRDAGNSSGGGTSSAIDGSSTGGAGAASSGGVSSGGGGGSTAGAGGMLTCVAGATFWNVQSRGTAIPFPEGPGCFVQCSGDKPCPAGTLCAWVPGCVCADATQCEACYAEWLCVDENLLTCKNLTDFARRVVDESPQFLCTGDADCVQASMDAVCSSACSVAVSKSSAATVAAAIATANAKWCAAALTRNCAVSTVDCAPGFPVCVGGRCEITALRDR